MNPTPASRIEPIGPIANDYTTVFASPDPSGIYAFSPGIAVLPGGRLLVTMDVGGPGAEHIAGDRSLLVTRFRRSGFGKVFLSDDGGLSWTHIHNMPLKHARPFVAGGAIYIIGQQNDLAIIRSLDNGLTWSEVSRLTDGQMWHQAPCNVHYKNDCVYLVMERICDDEEPEDWPVRAIAPVLIRACIDADLRQRSSWTFASELVFQETVDEHTLDSFGVPFYKATHGKSTKLAPGRSVSAAGWLETNVIEFIDPRHMLSDPDGRTLHLWMRAHTGGTGYAAIAKVTERPDGTMETAFETVPSGKTLLFIPCPGGQMKFHLLYDEPTQLFWLLSSQSTDSMTRPELLPGERYGLPNNERHRLQLHFSKNAFDWCFAALVAVGDSPAQARHYAAMAVDGDDLVIVSRSGDGQAASAHNGNLITFHRIVSFRKLAYV